MEKKKIVSLLVDLESDIDFVTDDESRKSLEIDLKGLMDCLGVAQKEMDRYRNEN